MNPRLRALLVSVLVLTSGAVVYTVLPGVTKADLLDAGAATDCVLKDVECDAVWDGGYVHRIFRAAKCPNDGGPADWIIPPRIAARVTDVSLNCRVLATCTTCDGGGFDAAADVDQAIDAPFLCSCSDGTALQLDGGLHPVGYTLHVLPGSAAGLVGKVCNETSGLTSWPSGCPLQ